MTKVAVWNNGSSWSEETICFFDHAPLSRDEVVRLVELLKLATWKSDQYLMGFANYEPLAGDGQGYGVLPLKEIADSTGSVDADEPDKVKHLDEINRLLAKVGAKMEAY